MKIFPINAERTLVLDRDRWSGKQRLSPYRTPLRLPLPLLLLYPLNFTRLLPATGEEPANSVPSGSKNKERTLKPKIDHIPAPKKQLNHRWCYPGANTAPLPDDGSLREDCRYVSWQRAASLRLTEEGKPWRRVIP
jgi:hypothetical protein